MDLQASEVEGSGYTLPPGWKAVESDKDHRIYYWNKKTGATTWKFPEHEGEGNLLVWSVLGHGRDLQYSVLGGMAIQRCGHHIRDVISAN